MDKKIMQMMKDELRREDLRIYTVVRLASQDIDAGLYEAALERLRVDADKLRCHNTPLNTLLR